MDFLIVNFKLDGATEEAWEQRARQLAPRFASMPNLLSKVWLADTARGTLWRRLPLARPPCARRVPREPDLRGARGDRRCALDRDADVRRARNVHARRGLGVVTAAPHITQTADHLEEDTVQTLDQTRVEAFAGQIATEIGAALNAALVTVGDELGLYRAMADGQPVTAAALAARTDTHERYVREWLNAQAAGGFVTYDGGDDAYTLPPSTPSFSPTTRARWR